tara:strand:+ start:544 stop:846 length:303 start_codon:yes stop_codon:yes gene_type:complete
MMGIVPVLLGVSVWWAFVPGVCIGFLRFREPVLLFPSRIEESVTDQLLHFLMLTGLIGLLLGSYVIHQDARIAQIATAAMAVVGWAALFLRLHRERCATA